MKPLIERRQRSARETFAACQLKYKAAYIDDVDMSSDVTRRGDTFHTAREIYIRLLWSNRRTNDHELARAAVKHANIIAPLPFSLRLDVQSLWERWTERYRLNLDTFIETEMRGRMCHYGCELRLDEVHAPTPDTLRIIDCKTNWQIPSQSALDESFQAALYLGAARRIFPGFARYEMVYDFVRYGQALTVTKSQAEMDAIDDVCSEQDHAMANAEATGFFPATGGALETVQKLAALHRASFLYRTALQGYCDAEGLEGVESHGVRWAYRPIERTQYAAESVIAALREHGFTEQAESVKLSYTAVKPYVTSKKKYKAVEPALNLLAVTTTRTEFGPRVSSLEDIPTPEDEA